MHKAALGRRVRKKLVFAREEGKKEKKCTQQQATDCMKNA
jgi:hypothetical protein